MAGKGYADPEVFAVLDRANRLVTETATVGTPLHRKRASSTSWRKAATVSPKSGRCGRDPAEADPANTAAPEQSLQAARSAILLSSYVSGQIARPVVAPR